MRIKVPKGVTRPTTDMVRQAVFSRLGDRVAGARVLDLFAGSGALGLEALSRGAASCLFIEENRAASGVIGENLAATGLEGGRVVRAEVGRWLNRASGEFDLVFADPPYARGGERENPLDRLLAERAVAPLLAAGGLMVIEAGADQPEGSGPGWQLLDRRRYGGSAILLYAREGGS